MESYPVSHFRHSLDLMKSLLNIGLVVQNNRFFSSKIMALTRVFFDMEADGTKLGRIIIELR